MIYDIRDWIYIYIFQMPPQVICRIHGPPSWACLGCKSLLSLGRKCGVVTLSRWCVSGDRGGCSFRRGLKSKFYQFTHTMVTSGIFPFKENSRHYINWPIRTPIFKRFKFQNGPNIREPIWTFPCCYTISPTKAQTILQDEYQPAFLIALLVPRYC